MRCPFCGQEETQVKDSRPTEDNSSIRRRRFCTECEERFTTFERVQLRELTVIKKDGRRQPFDRDKLIRSMQIALRKRPVDMEEIEKATNTVVRNLESMGEYEINSTRIGEMIMKALAGLDAVGYIRFASVYKDFRHPEDFNAFLSDLKTLQEQDKLFHKD
jgi:transcriptional repressor NrdR